MIGTNRAIVLAALCGALLSGCGGNRGGEPPEEAIVANARGAAALGQQEVEKAITIFSEAAGKWPKDPVLLSNLALARMQKGEFEDAEKDLRDALAVKPEFPAAHFRLGLVLKGRGATDEAVREFETVVQADPQDLPALYNLASLKARKGDLDGAIADYEKALALDPTHVSVLYGMGRALLQKGDRARGEEFLARSQKVRDELGIGETVGLQYGEQGKYSVASEYSAQGLAAPAAIAVQFEGVEGDLGSPVWALGDWNGDGKADLAIGEAAGPASAAVPPAGGAAGPAVRLGAEGLAFAAPTAANPPSRGTLLLPGDLTGDGTLDLLVAGGGEPPAVYRGDGTGRLERVVEGATLPAASRAAALLSDVDHDGDLDAVFALPSPGETKVEFFINAGGGAFKFRNAVSLPGAATALLAAADFDNDRDIDVVAALPGANTPLAVLSNRRDGSYDVLTGVAGSVSNLGAPVALAVADVDKDGFMDVLLVSTEARVLLNRSGRTLQDDENFRRIAAGAGVPGGAAGESAAPVGAVISLDFDNDGFLDVAASPAGKGLVLVRNLGAGHWENVTKTVLGSTAVPPVAPRLAAADLDGDGDLDLLAGSRVMRNGGGEKAAWVEILPRGVRDDRFGAGAKLEFRSGALWQKFEVGSSGLPVHMGLGPRTRLDGVRLLWPGGVLQDEIDVTPGGRRQIAQLDRKGTSCPILYAWNGTAMRFVTDFLGGSAYGYLLAGGSPPVWNFPDTDEAVRVRADQLVERNGRWELRMVNQLEEVIFYDHAELEVVDSAGGVEIYPDERLTEEPPFPQNRLFAVSDAQAPPWVRAGDGRDLTEAVAREDRITADGFELQPWKGYAAEHDLVFGLPEGFSPKTLILLLDGWIDYADSTSNLAASQAGATLMPPRLEARTPHAQDAAWRVVLPSMGFPAGLPKTMTVDLTGRLRAGETELRIRTSMRIYWDRIRFATAGGGSPLVVTRLAPKQADLRFLGYPAETSPDGRMPHLYDYDHVLPAAPWKAHAGAYTRFGDVRPLLEARDDRLVTTRHGDEIALSFDASAAPPLPAGWTRTFVLFVDGFGKDMDPNSAAPDAVGPLPFHAMPSFPYGPGTAPPDRSWLDEWNTRIVRADPEGTGGAAPPLARRTLRPE